MTSRDFNRKRKPEDNRARVDSPVKFCAKCETTKDKSEFAPMAGRNDGLRPYCRPCKAQESREYRARNPEVSAAASRNWALNNPEKNRAKMRRWQVQLHNRIHQSLTARMYTWVKGKQGKKTNDLIGYGWDELKVHLERQFLPGMSWENYGEWEIDHIVPLASFKVCSVHDPEVRRAWCLTNLRPLWGTANRQKSAKRLFLI